MGGKSECWIKGAGLPAPGETGEVAEVMDVYLLQAVNGETTYKDYIRLQACASIAGPFWELLRVRCGQRPCFL